MQDFAPFLPLAGGLLGLLCLVGAFRAGRRARLVENLPTSKTTGVFIGLVELKGTAESGQPLTSYLAEAVWHLPCETSGAKTSRHCGASTRDASLRGFPIPGWN